MHTSKGEQGVAFHHFPGQAGVELPPGQQGSVMHHNDSEDKHHHSEIPLLIFLPPALCAELMPYSVPVGSWAQQSQLCPLLIPAPPACWWQGC